MLTDTFKLVILRRNYLLWGSFSFNVNVIIMQDMGVALELLGVGLVTVFLILSLVVLLGSLIIRFVNRFVPEVQKLSVSIPDTAPPKINAKKLAAIVSAVSIVTKGTGRITGIDKF